MRNRENEPKAGINESRTGIASRRKEKEYVRDGEGSQGQSSVLVTVVEGKGLLRLGVEEKKIARTAKPQKEKKWHDLSSTYHSHTLGIGQFRV